MTKMVLALYLIAAFSNFARAADVKDGSKLLKLTLLGVRTGGLPQWYVSDDFVKQALTYVGVVNISDSPITFAYHSTGANITLRMKDPNDTVSTYELMGVGSGIHYTVTLKPFEVEILPARLSRRKLDPAIRPGVSREDILVEVQADLSLELLKNGSPDQAYRVRSEWFPFRLRSSD
jgi:hypothetical protein